MKYKVVQPDYWLGGEKVLGELEIENINVNEGWKLTTLDDVSWYLAYVSFANDFVARECIDEAIANVVEELGCTYRDVYELENDIRRYYI